MFPLFRLKASPGTPTHFGVLCLTAGILFLLENQVVFSSNEEKIQRNIWYAREIEICNTILGQTSF